MPSAANEQQAVCHEESEPTLEDVESAVAAQSSTNNDEFDDDCQAIFPQRLMSILSQEKFAAAISWLPHGRAFVIRDRTLFSETVMPKFFSRKSKYSSFTRKLNRWNFIRVSSGPELGAYYHEFFLRDRPQLAAQMFCKNARTKIAMAMPDNIADPSDPSTMSGFGVIPTASASSGTTDAQQQPSPVFPTSIASAISAMSISGNNNDKTTQVSSTGTVIPNEVPLVGLGGHCMSAANMDRPAVSAAMNAGIDSNIMGAQLLLAQQMAFAQKSQCMQGFMQKTMTLGMPRCGPGANNNNSNFPNPSNLAAACSPLAVQQQIEAHKQQQQHMMQLQQLMAMNLLEQRQRQHQRRAPSTNFRASAA